MQKRQSVSQQIAYWAKVVSLGMILGLGLQFAQAWVAPTAAPPLGNAAGPITTGSAGQQKAGSLALNTDGTYANALLIPNGNVGIGISPTINTRLQIADGLKTQAYNGTIFALGSSEQYVDNPFMLVFNRSAAGNGAYFRIQSVEQNVAYRNLVLQDQGGNVGIGTATPAQKLSVNGVIETFGAGGIKFPDGTVQTTAAGGGGLVKILQGTGCAACPYGSVAVAGLKKACLIKNHLGNLLSVDETDGSGGVLCKTLNDTGGDLSWKMVTY